MCSGTRRLPVSLQSLLLGKVENERTWRLFRQARSLERLRASMTVIRDRRKSRSLPLFYSPALLDKALYKIKILPIGKNGEHHPWQEI